VPRASIRRKPPKAQSIWPMPEGDVDLIYTLPESPPEQVYDTAVDWLRDQGIDATTFQDRHRRRT
jgi:hypothetical protein